MTEDEAATKWCPFARSRALGCEAAVNRPFGADDAGSIADEECRCVASACMAWRTIPPKSLTAARLYAEDGEKIKAIKALREVFSDLDLLAAKNIVEGKTPWPAPPAAAGYCGLAGSPQ